MNERIKELESQCWSHRIGGALMDGQLHFDTQKFAELIVQECIAQCNDGDSRWFIAQHFGVEE